MSCSVEFGCKTKFYNLTIPIEFCIVAKSYLNVSHATVGSTSVK